MGKVIGFAMDEIERNPAWIPALTRGGYKIESFYRVNPAWSGR
jgi:hypothetical protein